MDRSRDIVRPLRTAALLLGAWVALFGLEAAMSIAIAPRSTAAAMSLIEIDVGIAVLWTMLSVGIDAWHRRARALAPSMSALVAMHVPTLIIATLIDCVIARYLIEVFTHAPPAAPFMATVVYYADFDIVSYLVVVAVSEALLIRRAALARQQFATQLEASLSRARLDYLEAQLQPHFLFNSLGAVSELAYDAPATANRVLQQLIAIFRTALATKTDEITLGEEIIGIEPYLDIQRIRFADWLTIDYRIDDAAVDCVLPRFVLQPLVENAIRHGLSARSAAGTIEIAAFVEGGSLIVRVTDNGVGLNAVSASAGRGIGLANVRTRLAILYGDDNRLRLMSNSSGGAIAELTVPARRHPAAAHDARLGDAGGPPTAAESTVRVFSAPAALRHPAVAIGVAWLLFGLLWTQQSFAYDIVRHRLGSRPWLSIAAIDMTSALIWAVLTPIVLAAAKRYPIRRSNVIRTTLGYVIAGIVTTFVHAAVHQQLTARDTPLWSPYWQASFAIGFVIFFILAAIGNRRAFADWLRAREEAAATLTVELADAQRRAAALQVIPGVLLRALDGIATTVRLDPAVTERQLARLGDYLRLALEYSDARGIAPDRQHALDGALALALAAIGGDSGAHSQTLTRTA